MSDILNKIAEVLEKRKGDNPDTSYVSSLYQQGTNEIAKKIGEESAEVIIAAKSKEGLVHEVADLWFHTLVLLAHHGESPQAILDELERRFGKSGLKEKAERSK